MCTGWWGRTWGGTERNIGRAHVHNSSVFFFKKRIKPLVFQDYGPFPQILRQTPASHQSAKMRPTDLTALFFVDRKLIRDGLRAAFALGTAATLHLLTTTSQTFLRPDNEHFYRLSPLFAPLPAHTLRRGRASLLRPTDRG